MLKKIRSCDRLIFNMEIPIPGKTVYIETGPRSLAQISKVVATTPIRWSSSSACHRSFWSLLHSYLFGPGLSRVLACHG